MNTVVVADNAAPVSHHHHTCLMFNTHSCNPPTRPLVDNHTNHTHVTPPNTQHMKKTTQVIHEQLGIKHGCITTIHNLTNTQTIVDAPNTKKSDLRRARCDGVRA